MQIIFKETFINMSQIIGFPRIGKNRELKKVLEAFWSDNTNNKTISLQELAKTCDDLIYKHWLCQKSLSNVCINDFSLYDNVLDLAFTLGVIPQRFKQQNIYGLECYFAMARGNKNAVACEMTKWFNTNYHYVVPEISADEGYTLYSHFGDETNAKFFDISKQYQRALSNNLTPKISLIGLFTFLGLSKFNPQDYDKIFQKISSLYIQFFTDLIQKIQQINNTNNTNNTNNNTNNNIYIEFNEPIFSLGDNNNYKNEYLKYIKNFYNILVEKCQNTNVKLIITSYFEHSNEATEILLESNIYGIGLDFLYGEKNFEVLPKFAKTNKVLFAGLIDGRNIWAADLQQKLNTIKSKILPFVSAENLVITSSCSLLHVPFDKQSEKGFVKDNILSWFAFATDKINEIITLNNLVSNTNNEFTNDYFKQNQIVIADRKNSTETNNLQIRQRIEVIKNDNAVNQRQLPFSERIKLQHKVLNYPKLATTTIGSFPQTENIRKLRLQYKKSEISDAEYTNGIQAYIKDCIAFQESIGLDVLVHGEPERNDMVEYFGEQLTGFVFTKNAWVQSYGSRCVKPPIIYGDVARPKAMTVNWISYAQSLTSKIVKGMLTGPVTILNWSFVRDDLPRNNVCEQIAIAISDEINDLQNANIKIIQVDEAAFKEGYPLRKENIPFYESWSVNAFKLSTAIAKPQTQIHTHMCYSEFNAIIKTIEALDADVISIETSRSGNELLKIFKNIGYSHEIGPGVYDIHSPRIPNKEEIKQQIYALLEVLPAKQLWINPDCGLKTRRWEEVKPALTNLISAVNEVRKELNL